MKKELKNRPDAATGTTTAMDVDFEVENKFFNLKMKNRVVEDFLFDVEFMRLVTKDFTIVYNAAFEYRKDWRAEWEKYINEKFPSNTGVLPNALKYFDEHRYCFVNDDTILWECENYAHEHNIIMRKEYRENGDVDVCVIKQLDACKSKIDGLAIYIVNYVKAYREAMSLGIVEYTGEIFIPTDEWSEERRKELDDNARLVRILVCANDKGQMIDNVDVDEDGIVVYCDC